MTDNSDITFGLVRCHPLTLRQHLTAPGVVGNIQHGEKKPQENPLNISAERRQTHRCNTGLLMDVQTDRRRQTEVFPALDCDRNGHICGCLLWAPVKITHACIWECTVIIHWAVFVPHMHATGAETCFFFPLPIITFSFLWNTVTDEDVSELHSWRNRM